MTDHELLQRAREGDEAAFLEIYRRHGESVFAFAFRWLGCRAAAEDIAQECFLALVNQRGGFDPARGGLGVYLFGIARNLAWKTLRRRKDLPLTEEAFEGIPNQSNPQREALRSEVHSRVRAAVLALPSRQREALLLFQFHDLSLREISQITGDGIDSVKQLLHRARASLRAELSDLLGARGSAAGIKKASARNV